MLDRLNDKMLSFLLSRVQSAATELTVKPSVIYHLRRICDVIIRSENDKIVRLSDVNASFRSRKHRNQMTQSEKPLVGVAIVPLPGCKLFRYF